MKILIYISLLLILSVKCDPAKKFEGVRVTEFYEHCENVPYFEYGETITIGDPNNRFMITLPYNWEIQETYSDTLYGLVASNLFDSKTRPENLMSISVNGFYSEDSLIAYVKKEIKSLKRDRKIDVTETGTVLLSGQGSYWVKFTSEEEKHELVNIVHYVKSVKRNEIYIIQSIVYNTVNHTDILCYLKQLVNTFELVDI